MTATIVRSLARTELAALSALAYGVEAFEIIRDHPTFASMVIAKLPGGRAICFESKGEEIEWKFEVFRITVRQCDGESRGGNEWREGVAPCVIKLLVRKEFQEHLNNSGHGSDSSENDPVGDAPTIQRWVHPYRQVSCGGPSVLLIVGVLLVPSDENRIAIIADDFPCAIRILDDKGELSELLK